MPALCQKQQELIDEVQRHLLRISELGRAQAEALGHGNENLAYALDRELEAELGAKERALGALRQHREEHQC